MFKSESDAWRRSAAAVFPLRKCRRRLSLKGDASRKPLSSSRLLLELGRHWLPRVSRSGGGVMDARRGGRARLAAPAPPRAPPRPPPPPLPLPARPLGGWARARPASCPLPLPPLRGLGVLSCAPQVLVRPGLRLRGREGRMALRCLSGKAKVRTCGFIQRADDDETLWSL